MKKFMILYLAPMDAMKQMANSTPEDQKKGMDEWMNWAQKCGDKLVDMGTPLANEQLLTPDGKTKQSNTEVTGYSILQAENMEEAKDLLKGNPHISGWNAECSIDVTEFMPMPGMN